DLRRDRTVADPKGPGGGPGAPLLEPREVELERGQRLAQLVVNLSRDPSPLFFSGGLKPSGEGTKLLPRLLELANRERPLGDVALDSEMPGDAAGLVVKAHVVAFDPHRRAVEAALFGDAVTVAGIEQSSPSAPAGLDVVTEELVRGPADQLFRA